MYRVKVNNKYDFNIDKTASGTFINEGRIDADIRQLNQTALHVIHNLKSYNVEVVDFNSADKTAVIRVNNNTYSLSAKDQFDALLDKLGLSNLNAAKISELKAPMPGMVLKVFAAVGDEIKKGDNLFILEAMKMENIIKAPEDVTIKAVKINAGDKVEKGQVMVQFG